MTYIIENNVPIPESRSGGKKGTVKYPELVSLEVGQSLSIPLENKNYFQRLAASCSKYGKNLDREFTTRVMEDKYRIWRTR